MFHCFDISRHFPTVLPHRKIQSTKLFTMNKFQLKCDFRYLSTYIFTDSVLGH